jgi:hypothetical protein
MTEKLSWFAARMLFEARTGDNNNAGGLFEERLVLVQSSPDIEAASKKACKLGEAASDEYENEAGETVTWKFRELLDVVQLNETAIGDGSEVYHQYLSADEVDSVRASLRAGSL